MKSKSGKNALSRMCGALALVFLSGCGETGVESEHFRFCRNLAQATAHAGEAGSSYFESALQNTRARHWDIPHGVIPQAGLVFVSGMPGGYTEPVDGIYERLAGRFRRHGIPSVFVQYRQPGNVELSVEDALAGVSWVKSRGATKIGLLGWSFGGAVITHTAVRVPEVRTLVGFAAQSRFTEPVARFGGSILLFHDVNDENVPYRAANEILEEVPETNRKELRTLQGSDHDLAGAEEEIDPAVTDWLYRELSIEPCN